MDNNEFKTTVDKKDYDLKNAKKFLLKMSTKKISEREALELYSDCITPDITALKKAKSNKNKNKWHKILDILENLESVFTGTYLHYKDVPTISEKSIAEKMKLRFDEIANKEKLIDSESLRKYFKYLSPTDMYKNFNETIGSEENKTQVNKIENRLTNLIKVFQSNPANNAKKIKKRNNMLEIVERILYFNQLNKQERKGLKILTPSQINP